MFNSRLFVLDCWGFCCFHRSFLFCYPDVMKFFVIFFVFSVLSNYYLNAGVLISDQLSLICHPELWLEILFRRLLWCLSWDPKRSVQVLFSYIRPIESLYCDYRLMDPVKSSFFYATLIPLYSSLIKFFDLSSRALARDFVSQLFMVSLKRTSENCSFF